MFGEKKEASGAAVKKPIYKKWWFWAVLAFVCLAALSPKNSLNRGGGDGGAASSSPEVSAAQGGAVAESAAPAPQESAEETDGASGGDSYSVPLGDFSVVIQRHPVLNGSRTEALFDIGVGETTTAAMTALSSEDLSAFIAGLDFETHGYENIVLKFDDGTGLVFRKGSANFTDDYGVVDVAPGNFEMVERYGAIWNDTGEGWYYMTVEEMAAADSE